MAKQNLNIDRTCQQILSRSGLDPITTDRFASDPEAFRMVRERIVREQLAVRDVAVSGLPGIFSRELAALGAFVLLAVFGYFANEPSRSDIASHEQGIEDLVPAVVPAGVRPITPPDGVVSEQTASRAPQFYSASVRERAPKKRPVRREATARSEADAVEPAEFVSLGLRSTAEQASGGGRVVRVDLPAASLFAMGIDVPIENGAESVRADLIIGPDGVTRAVKLVE